MGDFSKEDLQCILFCVDSVWKLERMIQALGLNMTANEKVAALNIQMKVEGLLKEAPKPMALIEDKKP